MHRPLLLALSFATLASAQLRPDGATASFRGSLPPKPTAALSAEQESSIEKQLAEVTTEFKKVQSHERSADAAIFIKAVRYALDFDEWYDKKPEDGIKKATALLDEAQKRIASLKQNKTPWVEGSGQKVLGFYSKIDGSAQPYGVEVPEGLSFGQGKKPVPMWVWLHGRGDTATDLHFVYSRLNAKKPGQFQPKGTIVIHPFGRYCNGWKSAGETDVFEARDDAKARFNVDENRIALAGFSMGGAGAWHIGAHFADQWACVHTGAGFVDVKRYQKLTPDKMPPWYEQVLWGVYDVPDYALNFKNVPLISYSGENDTQRDSAEYMTEVLAKEGITRPHLIGPGMGHKYHPEVIKEVQALIEQAVEKGRDPMPKKVVLQTRSNRYNKMFWVELGALKKQWEDGRIEAEIDEAAKLLRVKTKNVASFYLDPDFLRNEAYKGFKLLIDGQALHEIDSRANGYAWEAPEEESRGGWTYAGKFNLAGSKGLGDDGLIDSFFQEAFTIVLPDKPCANPQVDAWVKAESQHFIQRWRSLMRGDPKVILASEIPDDADLDDLPRLCLWGDAQGNSVIARISAKLPFQWTSSTLTMAGKSYDAKSHVPVLSYRWNRLRWASRIVLNSGLTFREAHDRTNSLQNPKLPDWAILDITEPPTAESAGKVVAADFFDENWKVK
ncbi:Prolyl oligopeptidase family protein [Prosthecobacter debontii]|uniref:Prolyl oligopeptidase family protein n=1 Tax=Prosthecobacter debontii TaxID=48467 RepID=A0A1T4YIH5_9BACT|nr:prolyl oligopeptidase family serine peptidase [Prosthecobacter debontii]SKB01594.1 Prolyl oligopeptidase family protein [Prosthecobacter debontii]